MASVRSHVFLSWPESKDVELEGKPGSGGAAPPPFFMAIIKEHTSTIAHNPHRQEFSEQRFPKPEEEDGQALGATYPCNSPRKI